MNNKRKLNTATATATVNVHQPPPLLLQQSFDDAVSRKLRSKLPRRRRRHQLSAIVLVSKHSSSRSTSAYSSSPLTSCEVQNVDAETSSSLSSDSSEVSVKKRCFGYGKVASRGHRTAYSKRNEAENDVVSLELSECSCVDSCSVEATRNKPSLNEIPLEALKKSEVTVKSKRNDTALHKFVDSETVTKSEISSLSKFSNSGTEQVKNLHEVACSFADNDVISIDSVKFYCNGNDGAAEVESASHGVQKSSKEIAPAKFCNETDGIQLVFTADEVRKPELSSQTRISTVRTEQLTEFNKASINLVENDNVSVGSVKFCNDNDSTNEVESAANAAQKQKVNMIADEFDLECSEDLSNDSYSYSSAYSEIFLDSSEWDSLSDEYTPSTWYDSGSQFSEKSNPDTFPSPTFHLFTQFSQQFCRSTLALENSSLKLIAKDYSSSDVTLLGLEDEEHEESYRMFRRRERRHVYFHDYAAEYCSTTDSANLIIEQRLEMVHWIFEESTNKELQKETMFLGVSLLDRFLSKGYFKNKRNLQIAGIACLTLATRIEENQPYNSIRHKTFYVGENVYSRSEVVAMEWLVLEILNFQCFLPTIHSFLWFYLKAAGANEEVAKTVRYLAMMVLLGHDQLCYWPSTVAASLVILASSAAERGACCHLVTECHAREKDDDLPECMKSFQWLVKYC